MVTYRYFPLPLPFIFTAGGNVETTPTVPVAKYTFRLRREDRVQYVSGYRVQVLKNERRNEAVLGERAQLVRRENRLVKA
jgi:hypothetical protein